MRIFLGFTGASGSVYGIRFLEFLAQKPNMEVFVTSTQAGLEVCLFETGVHLKKKTKELGFRFYSIGDYFAPPSSGSFRLDGVVILPCSMGTLARIAGGMSTNLLERVADVALKEGFPLILSPRETPLNSIQLSNMLKLVSAGAKIVPPNVAFYTRPKTLEEIIHFHVGKILDLLGITDHALFPRWKDQKIDQEKD